MDKTFYPYIIAFGWISFFLLIGTILRYKVKFFQNMLLPSSIIGGLLGCILINMGVLGAPTLTEWVTIGPDIFGVITYHLFILSLLCISLIHPKEKSKNSKKIFWKGAWWIAAIFSFCYCVQGLFGLGIFTIFQKITQADVNPIVGLLLSAGFTQGPGQAIAYGNIYEGAGISHAVNLGIIFAAAGFFACSFVGIPLAKYGIKKGWCSQNSTQLNEEVLKGVHNIDNQCSTIKNVTHNSNVESLGYHFAIVFVIYFIAYCFAIIWTDFMPQKIKPLGFGMLFLWAMLIAIAFQNSLHKINLGHWIDNETSKKLSGFFVDFMVTGVFMSIQLVTFVDFYLPIIIGIVGATVLTLFIALWFGRRLPELGFERMLYIVGTCTGTSATGLLLVRMADPEFKTSVASEGAMFNVPVQLLGIAPIYSLPLAYISELYWIIVASFVGTIILMPIILYYSRLIVKPKF